MVLDLDECICLRCDDGAPVEDDCCCAQAAEMSEKYMRTSVCTYSKIVSWLYYLLKSKLTADLAKAKFVTGIAMGTAAVMDENAEG